MIVQQFPSFPVAQLDPGHEHSSGAARGATGLEEIPSRLELHANLFFQSLAVHGHVQTSPCLLLLDAQAALSHISPSNSPAGHSGCFPALLPLLLGLCVWDENSEASPHLHKDMEK